MYRVVTTIALIVCLGGLYLSTEGNKNSLPAPTGLGSTGPSSSSNESTMKNLKIE